MVKDMKEALDTVKQRNPNNEMFLKACEYLVANRGDIPYRVFINLPGGLRGNTNPIWDDVKAQSESRCSCGNERVIYPLNPRKEYVASEAGSVTLAIGQAVYLRPIGGDLQSTYVKLEIEKGGEAVSVLEDPFAPFVFSLDVFSTKGFILSSLAQAMKGQDTPAIFMYANKKIKAPVFAINQISVDNSTITITPDVAVEVLYMEQVEAEESDTKHQCNN